MEITGHKTINGSYVTKAEAIKGHNKLLKEDREAKQKHAIELEKQEQLIASAIHEQFKEEIQAREKQKIHTEQCKQFISYAAEFMPNYSEYLTAYDIANGNIYQIETDINRNKITVDRVKQIYKQAQTFIDNIGFTIDSLSA